MMISNGSLNELSLEFKMVSVLFIRGKNFLFIISVFDFECFRKNVIMWVFRWMLMVLRIIFVMGMLKCVLYM